MTGNISSIVLVCPFTSLTYPERKHWHMLAVVHSCRRLCLLSPTEYIIFSSFKQTKPQDRESLCRKTHLVLSFSAMSFQILIELLVLYGRRSNRVVTTALLTLQDLTSGLSKQPKSMKINFSSGSRLEASECIFHII